MFVNLASLLTNLVPLLINFENKINEMYDSASMSYSATPKRTETFDYIIIGSGSAGAVVANRLSEYYNVLLLEAGGTPSYISEIPLFRNLLLETDMVFKYQTETQNKVRLTACDASIPVRRGKCLGGSSSLNSMMYVRGNSKDFDLWATLTNDSTWTAENIIKYFKHHEDYHGNYDAGNNYGIEGETYVGKQAYYPKLFKYFQEWTKEQNITTEDFNKLDLSRSSGNVFGIPDVVIKGGRRWGTYQAFLKPILDRTTLTIYRYAVATEILLDQNNKAYGVKYRRHGAEMIATVTKEVILSAGNIESPKLLMLSGIGDRISLKKVGIHVKMNLPGVGRNIQDHSAATVLIGFKEPVSFVAKRDLQLCCIYEYFAHGSGPLSSIHRIGIGVGNTSHNIEPNWQDLYFFFQAGFSINPDTNIDTMLAIVNLVRPRSKITGYINLMSAESLDAPLINPNVLSDEKDFERLVDGIMYIQEKILSSPTFQKLGAYLLPRSTSSCADAEIGSRKYWNCIIPENYASVYNLVGGCRMGIYAVANSVVDSRLRVHNTLGLRVIDSSIMPVIPTGNPHAVTMMIGEVGAEMVLNDA